MDCPKCGNELSETLFDPESWDVAADFDRPQKCSACGLIITKEIIRDNMKPSDCILVQNEEIEEDEFCGAPRKLDSLTRCKTALY